MENLYTDTDIDNDFGYYDELPEGVYEYCPRCGDFLDDADFDFQICSRCKWNNKNDKNK
jgi:hypothetical protein